MLAYFGKHASGARFLILSQLFINVCCVQLLRTVFLLDIVTVANINNNNNNNNNNNLLLIQRKYLYEYIQMRLTSYIKIILK